MNLILQAIKALFRKVEGRVATLTGRIGKVEAESKKLSTGIREAGILAGEALDAAAAAASRAATAQTTANAKMSTSNPTGTGSFSMNRKSDTIIGWRSHAEGNETTASGNASHAEGTNTTASGLQAHAEGNGTTASGGYSHAEGNGTTAAASSSHVQGKYNVVDNNQKYSHIVGNGASDTKRSNAHTLDWNGVGWFAGGLQVGGNAQDDEAKNVLLEGDDATEEYISSLIDAKLGVIENGTY